MTGLRAADRGFEVRFEAGARRVSSQLPWNRRRAATPCFVSDLQNCCSCCVGYVPTLELAVCRCVTYGIHQYSSATLRMEAVRFAETSKQNNTERYKVSEDNHHLIRFGLPAGLRGYGVSSSPKCPDPPWDLRILPAVVRRGREADHSPPTSGAIPPLLLYAFMACSRSFLFSCVWFLESPG